MSDKKIKKYGLIGRSLSHSFSEEYFTNKFSQEKIAASYKLYPLEKIEDVVTLIQDELLDGFNVTIPYKQDIIPFLDDISEEAIAIGAVNTVRIENGKMIGYNTDVFGFQESLKPFLKRHHRAALILGTGGASKAVSYVLDQLGLSYIFISRNAKGYGHKEYADVNEVAITHFPLLINTTPLGTFPNTEECPNIPFEFITDQNFLYDLVYNPKETKFLKEGISRGAQVMNGIKMLHFQADKAWEIWNSGASL